MKFKLNKKNIKNLSKASSLNQNLTPKIGGGHGKRLAQNNAGNRVPQHSDLFETCVFTDFC
ncbi:hypothetical protein L1077_26165 [Pseudoalteromonas luteoviolacea]|uniref:Uncharacterized protein n=1 Tax=Pseudoalteromonas luteoviolacea H33 TaxID=1365251 RepID=A0A167FV28_9GAMM|nr:hypothetical protein [Pseudoalteromonas luteoviolacea]KZN53021.1 hypothetical protein N476_09555 [Pseudoalteromonas luteoviolacea H33]KZN78062.1 hypothetical protein N477_10510 [Pseudoalteromonas luteoviolacea H33-S]MCF6442913.1 hypothetical protein [Pseudoalteromonas luteoviolacea]